MDKSSLDTMLRIMAVSPRPSLMADPKHDGRSFDRHLTEADPKRQAPATLPVANDLSPAKSSHSETERQNPQDRTAADRAASEPASPSTTDRTADTGAVADNAPSAPEEDLSSAMDPSTTNTLSGEDGTQQEGTAGTNDSTAIPAPGTSGIGTCQPPQRAAGEATESALEGRPATHQASNSTAVVGAERGGQENQDSSLQENSQGPIAQPEATAHPASDSERVEETQADPAEPGQDPQSQNGPPRENNGIDPTQNTTDPTYPEPSDRNGTEVTATAVGSSLARSARQEDEGLQETANQRRDAASHAENAGDLHGQNTGANAKTMATTQQALDMEAEHPLEGAADEPGVETHPRFAPDGVGRGPAPQPQDPASGTLHALGRMHHDGTAIEPSNGDNSIGRFRIDREHFVARVAKAFQLAEDRGGQLRLRLSPPELGSIRLELAVKNGAVSATIETDSAAARHVLLDNLPALRDRLADQNIRIEQFHIDVRDESAGHQQGQTAEDSRQPVPSGRPDGTRRNPQDNDHQATADRAKRTPRSRGDEMLDVLA